MIFRREIWKDIIGYEGYYMVSNRGRVKSLDKEVPTILTKTGKLHYRNIPGKILVPWDRGKGYATVGLLIEGKRKAFQVHCLVLAAFVGPLPDGLQTRHLNGRRLDNRICNLAYGTSTENTDDKFEHGTIITRLTEEQARYVWSMNGIKKATELSRELGVSVGCIKGILFGLNWKWIHDA